MGSTRVILTFRSFIHTQMTQYITTTAASIASGAPTAETRRWDNGHRRDERHRFTSLHVDCSTRLNEDSTDDSLPTLHRR